MSAIKRSLDEWAVIIEEMQASGISQKQWCSDHDINWSSMHCARMRLKGKSEQLPTKTTSRFLRVQAEPSCADIIFTCEGITITTTAQYAAAILQCLAGDIPC